MCFYLIYKCCCFFLFSVTNFYLNL
eukprot:UN08665